MNQWVFSFIFLFILVLLELLAVLLLSPHPKSNVSYGWEFYGGVATYVLIAVIFGFLMRHNGAKLGTINTTWQCMNIVIVFFVSLIFLGEKFMWLQWVGVALAAIAAACMAVPEILEGIKHTNTPP